MANRKLFFDDEIEEDFLLVAIHCSEEEYKMAYLLNSHLGTKFVRRPKDLDITYKAVKSIYPIYGYEDVNKGILYHLISNRGQSQILNASENVGLFDSNWYDNPAHKYLIPELKKVDYFLKIESESDSMAIQIMISQISSIKEVISAYLVENENIKSKDNLIFD